MKGLKQGVRQSNIHFRKTPMAAGWKSALETALFKVATEMVQT